MTKAESISILKTVSVMKEAEKKLLNSIKNTNSEYDKVCTAIVQTGLSFSCEEYMKNLYERPYIGRSFAEDLLNAFCESYKSIILGSIFTKLFYNNDGDDISYSSELNINIERSSSAISDIFINIDNPSYEWPDCCNICVVIRFNVCNLMISNMAYNFKQDEEVKILCLIPIKDTLKISIVSKYIREYVDELIKLNSHYILAGRKGADDDKVLDYYSERLYNIFMECYMYSLKDEDLKKFISSGIK